MSEKQLIQELCNLFEVQKPILESSEAKYGLISSHNSFKSTTKYTKSLLSAVCLYLTLCEDNKPLTITKICTTIGCDINEFGKVYNQVIKEFPELKNDLVNIEKLVEVTIKEINFEDEEREQLKERIIQLIRIVKELGLIEGRSPVHIIFAAAFLGWKSLRDDRRKVKLTEFCVKFCIDIKQTTNERINEMFNVLKSLAQKIPRQERVVFTKQNITVYIDYIVKYSSSLMYDLMSSNPSNHLFINDFKRKLNYEKNETIFDEMMQTFGSNDGKQVDEEISDTEIDLYIRSPKEVKRIKKLKKFVEREERVVKELKEGLNPEVVQKYLQIDGLFSHSLI